MKTKYCDVCGEIFTPKSNSQKICSEICVKKRKAEQKAKCLEKYPNLEKESRERYYQNNKDKISLESKERWLKKNNKTKLSEKGKKANITREKNKEIIICTSTKCLLKEFGDIE